MIKYFKLSKISSLKEKNLGMIADGKTYSDPMNNLLIIFQGIQIIMDRNK